MSFVGKMIKIHLSDNAGSTTGTCTTHGPKWVELDGNRWINLDRAYWITIVDAPQKARPPDVPFRYR